MRDYKLENDKYVIVIKDGIIKEFYDKSDITCVNLAGKMDLFGSVGFTLESDDITAQEEKPMLTPYADRTSVGKMALSNNNTAKLYDSKYCINTCYSLDNGLTIEADTENSEISQFGINIELNFLGKTGTSYRDQILPTSPYTSDNKKYMYCIMTRPNGGFLVCTALTECDGWKIDYSPEYAGHYILNFKFLASFDKVYNGSKRKKIKVNIQTAKNIEEVYDIIHLLYDVPYCNIVAGGNFGGGDSLIKVSGDTETVKIISPSGTEKLINTADKKMISVAMSEYGFYKVIPYNGEKQGIDAMVWNGKDMKELFELSTASIRKPYHGDFDLCEGGCYLWSMLSDMRICRHLNHDSVARHELDEVMGKNDVNIERRTILPYKTERFDAFHISNSIRIQEQFFGVSILLEAYKFYKEKEYLEFAASALDELVRNWITDDGMITNGEDYTTVCAPVIPVVDMANLLFELKDARAQRFYDTAVRVAEYLMKRGLNFPTEGTGEDSESDAEDGSVSCTALSLLYVCANLHYDKRYIDMATEVLEFHKAWTIYSPDCRMNGSSFRWWETIWEGDGEGPAICAGHAWTIWKAEALFLYAMLTYDEQAILDSWNGYITNFAKTDKDGVMYACFEADYIRGGGTIEVKKDQLQLAGEDISTKYVISHCYPKHPDNSLSRYAWVRNAYSWYNTAAVIEYNNTLLCINSAVNNEVVVLSDQIERVFIGKMNRQLTIECKQPLELISKADYKIIQGDHLNDKIKPADNKIIIHIKV